jgi:roadblock/LC7 domain-containing protein
MAVCDICSMPMDFNSGYALTTKQVTTEKNYWDYMLEAHSFSDDGILLMYVQQQAMQRSGWLVCESCSTKFIFDRIKAKEYASLKKDPPGSGPVEVEQVAAAAAAAWKSKYGSFPSWVR